MKKCLFLVHHKDVDSFLERMHNAGVLHVEIDKQTPNIESNLAEQLLKMNSVSETIKRLEKLNVTSQEESPSVDLGEKAYDIALAIKQRRDQVLHDQQRVEKDLKVMEQWGDFSFDTINKLEESGLITGFYTCSTKNYQEDWEIKYNSFVINKVGSSLLFVTFTKEAVAEFIEAESFKLADKSLAELTWKKKHLADRQNKIDGQEIELIESSIDSMKLYLNSLRDSFDLETVHTKSPLAVDEKVFLLQGYIPSEKEHSIKELLQDEAGVYYEMREPHEEDAVPVKLKNNSFFSLFETIGGLYNLPNYKELDMTPLMAPFYLVFFGFCLQDMGYGFLLFFGGIFLRKKMPHIKNYLKLATYFGISTIVFGGIVGNVFGVNLAELKDAPTWLAQIQSKFLTTNDMFNFALILGAIQIIFGMGVKVVNSIIQKGIKYSLAPIGWLLLILGMISITLLSQLTIIDAELAKIAYYSVGGISGLLILFLNNPSKNPLANLGAGLWEVYGQSTGLMGDLMSYTRLFALGVSGAVLGFVFNELAVKMSPDNMFARVIVMIIILAFGHGLTIFMSCLGSFVHPVRLTFVEFYKNSGFEGTGKAYKPFSKNE